jgi:Rrf2 family transcriptional regulator, iron-sulfur cluster assembly transcription factor
MMNLSKTVGYAVHALSCLEQAQGQPLFVQEIAERTGIHKPYLARIVNRLVHRGLIASKRGYRGGVVLARPANEIPLHQIVEALEAESWSQECFFGLESCPATRACPAHTMWAAMRAEIENALRNTTLADVTRSTCPEREGLKTTSRLGRARLVPRRSISQPRAYDLWGGGGKDRAAAAHPAFLASAPPVPAGGGVVVPRAVGVGH